MTTRPREIPSFLQVPWGIPSALWLFVIVWIIISMVLVIIAMALAPIAPAFSWFSHGIMSGDVYANFIFTTIDTILGFGVIWYFLRRNKSGWKTVGWRKFSIWKAIAFILAIFISFILLANLAIWLASVLIPGFDANQAQTNDFTSPQASGHHIIVLIALVIFPAIMEETAFRGFIFPAFSKKFGLIWGAVISSLLFAFAHLQFNVGIYTFILGLLLCFMYVKLKSIIPGVILHAINNALALTAMIHLK